MTRPSTCCNLSGDKDGCVCAAQAKCACGKQPASACDCGKSTSVSGPKCSCRMRPAGECTCERAVTENKPVSGESCPCGKRPAESCTCEKADVVDSATKAVHDAIETDFTTISQGRAR